MTSKIKRILRITAWYTLCFMFLLTMKTPFGVRINYDKGFITISIVFACAAIVFLSRQASVSLQICAKRTVQRKASSGTMPLYGHSMP